MNRAELHEYWSLTPPESIEVCASCLEESKTLDDFDGDLLCEPCREDRMMEEAEAENDAA